MDPNSLSAAVIEVKNCKDRLSHLGNPKLTSAEFADHEKWMRQLIEKSGFSKNAKKKYMANLCKLISIPVFKERLSNGEQLADLIKILMQWQKDQQLETELKQKVEDSIRELQDIQVKLDAHDARLDVHDARLDVHDTRLDAQAAQIHTVTDKVASLQSDVQVQLDGQQVQLDAFKVDQPPLQRDTPCPLVILTPDMEKLIKLFSKLVGHIAEAVRQLNDDRLSGLIECINAQLSGKRIAERVPHHVNAAELIGFLQDYWSYLNFDFAELVINYLENDNLRKEFKSYMKQLRKDVKTTLQQCKKKQIQLHPPPNCQSMLIEVTSNSLCYSLEDILQVKEFLINRLGLKPALFSGFLNGSIILYFYITMEDVEIAQHGLKKHMEELQTLQVTEVKVLGNFCFHVEATPGSSVVKDIKSDQELRKPHEKMVALKPRHPLISVTTQEYPTESSPGGRFYSPELAEMEKVFQLLRDRVIHIFLWRSIEVLRRVSMFVVPHRSTMLLPIEGSSATLMSTKISSATKDPYHLVFNGFPLNLVYTVNLASTWYEVSVLQLVTGFPFRPSASEGLESFVQFRDATMQCLSLPECFPHGPLSADQLAPPPGYTSLRLALPDHPEDVPMGCLWSLKKHLCSSLALQPYTLLLKGYMEGICQSTHIIFHISRHVTLDEDQVAAMFVGAKRAGLYPHSIITGFSTAQEVEYHLIDIPPLVKMRKVKGQMEGLTIAEKGQHSATEGANDQ